MLASDWRATVIAHSFQDPLWRAVMEAEVKEGPESKSFIENKCQTCHAPLAWSQARAEGTNELSFAAVAASPVAPEGVGCTLCHQIQPGNLGTLASFSGHFLIGTNREIFGPYHDVLTLPMQRHVNYTPRFGAHLQDSALCATCHSLFTPILDLAGTLQRATGWSWNTPTPNRWAFFIRGPSWGLISIHAAWLVWPQSARLPSRDRDNPPERRLAVAL